MDATVTRHVNTQSVDVSVSVSVYVSVGLRNLSILPFALADFNKGSHFNLIVCETILRLLFDVYAQTFCIFAPFSFLHMG